MIKGKTSISFRCYFENESFVTHHQSLDLWEIEKWLACYLFTHPGCTHISVLFDFYEE